MAVLVSLCAVMTLASAGAPGHTIDRVLLGSEVANANFSSGDMASVYNVEAVQADQLFQQKTGSKFKASGRNLLGAILFDATSYNGDKMFNRMTSNKFKASNRNVKNATLQVLEGSNGEKVLDNFKPRMKP